MGRGLAHIEIGGRGVDLPHPRSTGLGDEQRALIATQGQAVRKAEALGNDAGGSAGWVVLQDAPGRRLLQDVQHRCIEGAAPLRRRKASRGIGEIHLARARDYDSVCIPDGIAGDLIGKKRDPAIRADGEQTLDRIGGNQIPGAIEIESEHSPPGLREDLLRRTVGIHPEHPAAGDGRVELAVACQDYVLGPRLSAKRDEVQPGKFLVDFVRARVAGISRSFPRDGLNRYGPERQVGGQRENREREHPKNPSHSVLRSTPQRQLGNDVCIYHASARRFRPIASRLASREKGRDGILPRLVDSWNDSNLTLH